MKETDLKIGDWVSYEGEPIQIEDTINYLYIDGYHTGRCRTEELEPIPLTVEILEKNGWKHDTDEYKHYWKREHITFSMFINTPFSPFRFYYDDCCTIRNIKYVHELQHILWAFGLNDDITL